MFSEKEGSLEIYISGDRKIAVDLHEIFAQTILNAKLDPEKKDGNVYNLNSLLSRDFQFIYDPLSSIKEVIVKRLKIKVFGTNNKLQLEADTKNKGGNIYDLLDNISKDISYNQMTETQVDIKVIKYERRDHFRNVTKMVCVASTTLSAININRIKETN